jgi:two-component system sporulation sensor kinase C
MDYFHIMLIGAITGTLSLIFVYIYLYFMYRERYIAIWAIAWFMLLLRNIFFDSGIFDWKQSILSFMIYQILFIGCSLTFIWGTYIFIDRTFKKSWIYGAASASLLSVLFFLFQAPTLYKLIPSTWFAGTALAWIAIAFFRHADLIGIGRIITGIAFALWSILTMIMPFFIETFSFLIASTGGVLRLLITISTVMVFLERSSRNLINKEARYRFLMENAIDVIYYYRLLPVAKIDYISPAIFPLTGYTSREYYADEKLVFNLIYPDDRHVFDNFINNPSQANELPITLRLVRKDNTILWIEQKCILIYDKTGNLVALEGVIRDITARKTLEQVAACLDRMNMVGNMAVTVAHEIRNPMTTIRGYLQLLEKKKEYQADKGTFDLMIEEIDRANAIIREYLALSREKLANLELCSLNYVIESLFPLIEADAIASKVYVNLDLADIPKLLLDKNEIRQMLLNLVRNSIEAMSFGGKLVIKTFQDNNNIILSIGDQGSGIPAHILDKLGTPFITTKDAGTGLGLPICYQIAHRHKASIDIKTSNQGTTISIHFKSSNIE